MKPLLYQEPYLPKFLEWPMMNWDITVPIELTPYSKDSITGKG